jgi:hypothetical protein
MSSVEINNQVNTVTVSENVSTVDITTSTAQIEVYNGGVGPQGLQGPTGVSGIVAQRGEPLDTAILWVDLNDIGTEVTSSPAGVVLSATAPSNYAQLWADTSTSNAQVAVFDGGTPAAQLTSVRMRRGTTGQWASNPILDAGEFGYNSSLNQFKIGDGTSSWSALSYVTADANLRNATVTGTTFTMTGVTVVDGTITGGTA